MKLSNGQLCSDILSLLSHCKCSVIGLAEEHGLTPVQMFALFSLEREGEISMGRIATTLHCDASNVTGLVDRLTAHGLVVRRESTQDRRAKTLELTAKGREKAAILKEALPTKFGFSHLSEEEQKTLHAIVEKISTNCVC